jgi:hypothetical protein
MSTKRHSGQTISEAAFAVPTRPISGADLVFLQQIIGDIAPAWSVQLQGICADEASLVLLPEGDDEMGPSFLVTRDTFGLMLDQVHWDELTEVGVFSTLQDIAAALSIRLAAFATQAVPDCVTIH